MRTYAHLRLILFYVYHERMAIYHLTSEFISRSSGRSAVQNAAYITGEALHESRRQLDVNYKNRASDVAITSTLIPNHTPQNLTYLSIWDKIESFEDDYAKARFPNGKIAQQKYMNTCRTAMTIIVALPQELSLDSSQDLVEEFLMERFVARGLVATYAIHTDAGNPHAHFLISMRSMNENGEFSWLKDREICTRRELLKTRSLWADKTNFYLEREEFEDRITEKSFLDLGIDLKPTKHQGWYADHLAKQGKSSRLMVENDHVFMDNKQKIEITPTVILDEITSKQATFSQQTLLRHIQKRIGDDPHLISHVFEACLKEAIFVGEHIDSNARYTSKNYAKCEKEAVSLLNDFTQRSFQQNITPLEINEALQTSYSYLSTEQKEAVYGLIKDNALSVLIGRAGSGKTTTLRAVSDIYKASGFQVMGCSLSALAAENLGSEANISSSTLHSLLFKLDALKEADQKFLSFDAIVEEGLFKQFDWYKNLKRYEGTRLHDKTVIIVDEAGMVGTKQWQSLLSHAKQAGSKIIAVGDDKQFKAVDAGDFFRAVKDHAKDTAFKLSTIRRQKVDWMKEASTHFSKLDVQEGLNAYHNRGCVHASDESMISTDMAKDYVSFRKQGKDVAVLAYTNAQTQTLNEEIRTLLKQDNVIGKETILTLDGKSFVRGDKVVFLKNDKMNVLVTNTVGEKVQDAFIKNGTVGTLLSHDKQQGTCVVELKDKTLAHFNITTYNHIDYGYALTIHKSQGQTVDVTLVQAHKRLESKALYVAMTRHRESAYLYYSTADFKSFNHLRLSVARFTDKDLVKDYTIRPENEKMYKRVQEYKLLCLDLAYMLSRSYDFEQKTYLALKKEQVTLGKEILNDFKGHQGYINQSGLTRETLEITTGVRKRPLSIIEEQAKLRVELYGETIKTIRSLWKDLKGKDVTHYKDQHETFKALSVERHHLAKDILENYRLHAPFVKEFQKEYFISQKTILKHGESVQKEWGDVNERKQLTHFDVLNPEKEFNTFKRLPPYQALPPFHKTSHDIVRDLNDHIQDIAIHFLGQPSQKSLREWRYGSKGSISLHIAGQKQGLYANFETGESGNVIKFIADHLQVNKKDAFKWGINYLNIGQGSLDIRSVAPIEKNEVYQSQHQSWTPTYPIAVPYPDLREEKQLSYIMRGRHEVARFTYKDADGHTLGYIVRLEDKEGHKITPALTYCQNKYGQKQWCFQGFGNDRPLYGLDVLKEKSLSPVLIVEGEKTCEAARLIFKDHAVITWSGGCGAVHKSDWSTLKGRDITIWPDHDKAGLNAATKIANILKDHAIKSIAIVDLPETLPHKWDLADKMPDGFNPNDVMKNRNIFLKKETKEISSSIIKEITSEHIQYTYQKFELYRFQSNLSSHQQDFANHIYENLKTNFDIVKKPEPNYLKDQAIIQSVFYDVAKKHYDIDEHSPLDTFKLLKEVSLFATQKFMKNPNYYLHEDKSLLIIHAQKEMQIQHLENEKALSVLQQRHPEISENVHKSFIEIFVHINLSTNSKIDGATKIHILDEIKNIHQYIEKHPKLSQMDECHKEVLLKNTLNLKMANVDFTREKAIFKAAEEIVNLQKQIEQSHIFEKQQTARGFER